MKKVTQKSWPIAEFIAVDVGNNMKHIIIAFLILLFNCEQAPTNILIEFKDNVILVQKREVEMDLLEKEIENLTSNLTPKELEELTFTIKVTDETSTGDVFKIKEIISKFNPSRKVIYIN